MSNPPDVTEEPIISRTFFEEIYQSKRGQTLKMYGAELSSGEEEERKHNTDEEDDE